MASSGINLGTWGKGRRQTRDSRKEWARPDHAAAIPKEWDAWSTQIRRGWVVMDQNALPFLFPLPSFWKLPVFLLLDPSLSHRGSRVGGLGSSQGTGCLTTAHIQDWGRSGDPKFCYHVFYDCPSYHQMELFKAVVLIVLKDDNYSLKIMAANLIKWTVLSPRTFSWLAKSP